MDSDNSEAEQTAYPKYAQTSHEPTVRHRIFGKTTSKLGVIATRASTRIKQLATHEVNLPPPRAIVAGLKQIIPGISHDGHDKSPDRDHKQVHKEPVKSKSKQEKADEVRNAKLQKILTESNEVLASASTAFPFSLFPDSVVLDRTKITITRNNFFFSQEVMSMRIDDILNVTTSVGPLLGSVTLAGRVLSSEDHFTIEKFWRQDAVHLKHIIQGYIIARHNKIDCEHLDKDQLIETLTKLGHDTN